MTTLWHFAILFSLSKGALPTEYGSLMGFAWVSLLATHGYAPVCDA